MLITKAIINRKAFGILFITMILFSLGGFSQDIVFSQNMFYKDNINPSSFLIANDYNVFLLYNNNMGGFDNNPHTQVVDFSMLRGNQKFGIYFINDKLGFDLIQNVKGRYAQKFDLTKNSSFSLGLGIGAVHRKLEVTKLTFDEDNDPVSLVDYAKTWFDYDFGAEYRYDRLYVGLSFTHFGKLLNNSANEVLTSHVYAYAQYAYEVNKMFTVYPSLLMRYWTGSFMVETGITAYYNNTFWGGVSFSDFQDLTFMAGLKVYENIMFGYAFKANLNQNILNPFATGTNEIFLNIPFNTTRRNVKTPRFID